MASRDDPTKTPARYDIELCTKLQMLLNINVPVVSGESSSEEEGEASQTTEKEETKVDDRLFFNTGKSVICISDYFDPYGQISKLAQITISSAIFMNLRRFLYSTSAATLASHEAINDLVNECVFPFFCSLLGMKLYPEKHSKSFEATEKESLARFFRYRDFFKDLGIPEYHRRLEMLWWIQVLTEFLEEKDRMTFTDTEKRQIGFGAAPPIDKKKLRKIYRELERAPNFLLHKEKVVIQLTAKFKEVFEEVNLFNYLSFETFREEGRKREKPFYFSCSFFIFSLPRAQQITYDGHKKVIRGGIAAFYCFLFALRADPQNFPQSFNQVDQGFLLIIKEFCEFFHFIGVPNDEEIALLSQWLFLASELENPRDRALMSILNHSVETIMNWYSHAYLKRRCSVKLQLYCCHLYNLKVAIGRYLNDCGKKKVSPVPMQLMLKLSFK